LMAGTRDRNRTLKLLLVALAVVVLVLYGCSALSRAFRSTQRPEASSAGPGSEQVTLWDGYGLALQAVTAKTPDAQLVSAGTQWRSAIERQLLAGASTWSFVFYSPQRRSTFDVAVREGGVRVVRETEVWRSPQPLPEGKWRKGPQDALLVFLAYGGREFIEANPDAVVDLHLASRDDGRPVWTIVALADQSQAPNTLQIDAETGEVLLNSFGSGG